jgi:hypothetical protein
MPGQVERAAPLGGGDHRRGVSHQVSLSKRAIQYNEMRMINAASALIAPRHAQNARLRSRLPWNTRRYAARAVRFCHHDFSLDHS